MAETTANPGSTPPSAGLGHQPALDGVRAIAVSMVVLFHYKWSSGFGANTPLHGGFLGVDVFFVLSGFLITTLLLQERARHGGVNLRHFYARRALRLLPAFGVLWIVALALHFNLNQHCSIAAGTGSVRACGDAAFRPDTSMLGGSFFYVANWVVIHHQGSLSSVLGPTWSLAIEEQFYLVWPIVLIALLHTRLRLRTVGFITAAGALTSAVYRAVYWNHHLGRSGAGNSLFFLHRYSVWNRIYLGSDTRADALLAGCFTAIVLVWLLPRLSARARMALSAAACFAFAGGVVIVTQAFYATSGWLAQWGFLTFEVCIAVVIGGIVTAPRAPLARLLSPAPLTWIGRRSYAIYLFNTLVFFFCNRSRVHLAPPLSFVFQIAVLLVAAELSHRLVEAPMLRRKQRFEPDASATPEQSWGHSS